ncbi:hypothetical protein PS623_04668 [Pseudomonas fluorescens]|nr:hypothetical protein PS623_04668 [Pseudomonas fluorescens]
MIDGDARCEQRVAHAVGGQVEPGVVKTGLQAARHDPLRMGGDARFKQLDIALFKAVGMLAAVAVFEQEALFFSAEQRQRADLAVKALDQRQQQALEFGQQALDRGVIEIALVKRQVQA